ncbi:MAG: hypothetical protein K9H84_01400 [Bacteroidales bacterium]|nr:hypothetical protein [Bacteroidales bacterium]
MKKLLIYILIAILSGLMFLSSCTDDKDYPIEPKIKFEDFRKVNQDSTGIITLSYTDGDGDIGLAKSDTLYPYDSTYFYNFFLYIFERKNGQYDSVQTSIPYHGRIPLLENVQEGESIEGEIEMELDIFSMDVFIPGDTVVFDIFIVDRALHHSNTVRTPPIILNSF